MTKTLSWGGPTTNNSFSSFPGNIVYRDGNAMATANLAANGNRPIKIHSCSARSLTNGSAEINYGGSGVGTVFATSGGTFRFQCRNSGGTMTFARASGDGGTIVDAGDGGTWAGSIPGSLEWSGVPSVPLAASVSSPSPGVARVAWSAPSDDGGQAVNGYRVQRATNAAFTTGVTNFELGNVLTYDDTTAVPGSTYYYRVFAKNATANAAGTTSVGTSGMVVQIKSGGDRWSGSAEIATTAAMRWDGTQEVPITTAVRWDGTAEVPLT